MARMKKIAMSRFVYASAVALSLLSARATADEGSICACSPSKYTFTLDFSLTCPPVDVTKNDGIAATFCQISPFGDADQNIEDLIPVEVENINVLELGQNFQVLSQQNITGFIADGESFDYHSVLLDPDIEETPKVIQLNIFARNANNEPIVNFFAISFSNNCDAYPTLIEGESAGWTHFTKLEAPTESLCPAAPETEPPTDAPTAADLPIETEPPTAADLPIETEPPTLSGTTATPTFSPTVKITAVDKNEGGASATPVVETEPPEIPESDAPVTSPVIETEPPETPESDAPVASPAVETEPPEIPESDAPVASPLEETDEPTASREQETEPPEIDAPTASPTQLEIVSTVVPTTMSMDLSTDSLDELLTEAFASVDMSMSMSHSSLRVAETKSAKKAAKDEKKAAKYEKYDKSSKKEKYEKYEKYEKSAKSEKYEKYEKSSKYDKKEGKSDKKDKSDKKEKHRRLRVRPLFEAV